MNKTPILFDFPSEFQTERLTLRSPQPGDGPAMNDAVKESIEELRERMPWARNLPTLEESETFLRQAHMKFMAREDLQFLVFSRNNGKLVASTGLHRFDWKVPRFEIGYWVRTAFTGQGYATEIVRGLTRFAFDTLGARRVEIRMDPRNVASEKVAIKAGYELEGTLRNIALGTDDLVRDQRVYSLIK